MGLKGNLAELPLADLIEMTALGGKTGRLTLFDGEGAARGSLAFRDGRLVGTVCGALDAEKAFYTLLALREGTFDFDPDAELDDESCSLPIAPLLLEGMRRLDERRREHGETSQGVAEGDLSDSKEAPQPELER